MKSRVPYIKDTNDLLFRLKNLRKIPENVFLVTADVVGLYPGIPYDEGLQVLRKQLNTFDNKSIPTKHLVKMAEFVLKNNYLEINSTVKHQISGTAIGTKCPPLYACIFMDYTEREFLKSKQIQHWIWFRYFDDIFFIWTVSEKELDEFLNHRNSFHPNLRFTHDCHKESLNFLVSLLKFNKVNLLQTYILSPQMHISIFILTHATTVIRKPQLLTAKPSE